MGQSGMQISGPDGSNFVANLQPSNPYTYLVDVLQRTSQHPASKAIELTPRVWKEKHRGCHFKKRLG